MENLNFLEDTFFERDVTFFRFDIFFLKGHFEGALWRTCLKEVLRINL